MTDAECVEFLRWALPRLGLSWDGFRKVRRQVCRRIRARISALGLGSESEYRALLEREQPEWEELDRCCRITISRFYRDRGVFDALGQIVLPALASDEVAAGRGFLRAWSVGCASGEEPYSLVLLWHLELAERFPEVVFEVLATDVDATVLERGARGCYARSSLKDVPRGWLERGFSQREGQFCVRPRFREPMTFMRADVRGGPPGDTFQLILCRNLAFTYFAPAVQIEVLETLRRSLAAGGALVVGSHEVLPANGAFDAWEPARGVFRRPL